MTFTIATDPAPIAVDADGVARVGGTRVTLDVGLLVVVSLGRIT